MYSFLCYILTVCICHAMISAGPCASSLREEKTDNYRFTEKENRIINKVQKSLFKLWGDYNKRKELIIKTINKHAIHPNLLGNGYKSPLCEALDHNDEPYVQFLLEKKVDPNDMLDISRPILCCAHTRKIAQLMLHYGADKSLKEHGSGILNNAVWCRNVDLVQFYIDLGIDPNGYDSRSCSPLYNLVQHVGMIDDKQLLIAKYLIQNGVLVSSKKLTFSWSVNGVEYTLVNGYTIVGCIKEMVRKNSYCQKSFAQLRKVLIDETTKRRQLPVLVQIHLQYKLNIPRDLAHIICTYYKGKEHEEDYERIESENG